MKSSQFNQGLPSGNPLANILVIIVGTLAIAASIVLGFFAFIIVGSIVLIMASIIGLRVWWFNRKLRQQAESAPKRPAQGDSGVIEGEFKVVADDRDDA